MNPAGESPALPGPKKKQAQAVFENVDWMARTFGEETIGFLTMTCGDYVMEGGRKRFVKISDAAEMQRRWNSFLTNVLSKRYRVGVAIVEPHKDGGLHFHLVCAVGADIKSGFDFEKYEKLQGEVRDGRRTRWRAAECGANRNLVHEWAFFRRIAERYGFGRCNLQPVRASGAACARYAAKYVTKGFEHRRAEHKGMRCVRYFGDWQTREQAERVNAVRAERGEKPLKARPRFSANRGSMTPRARAWRECVLQIALASKGQITQANVRQQCGQRWAWGMTKQMRATEFLDTGKRGEAVQEQIRLHNEEALAEFGTARRAVWERHPSFWLRDVDEADGVPVWLHFVRLENQAEINRAIARETLENDENFFAAWQHCLN